MWARILCTSVPRDAARSTVLLCTQLGHLNGHCLYNSSASTCQVCSTVLPQGTGSAAHTHAEPSYRASHSSNQSGSRAAGNVSSSSSTISSSWAGTAGVIFRHALFKAHPCMWAAQTPHKVHFSAAGDAEAGMITRKLTSCRSLAALSDVYNEWGGKFGYIQAAAALSMYAKLRRRREADTQLLPKLLHCWLQQLPDAGIRQCANVLWALGKLGTGLDKVWKPTFEAALRLLQQSRSCSSQDISHSLWACATLRKQPAPDQLAVLMQAILLPEVLAAAEPQHLANIVWALGKLCKLQGWQGGVSEEAIQQLLGEQQLQLLAAAGTSQASANVLLGLTYMSKSAAPVVSKAFAKQCSRQLLASNVQRLVTACPQELCNTMWACGELGLADHPFLTAAAAAAADWVPISQLEDVIQAATACAKLQFRHQGLLAALLQRGQQLLQLSGAQGRQQKTLHSRGLRPVDKDGLVARLCSAVSHLDMQQLAPQALQLVAASGIRERPDTHPSNLVADSSMRHRPNTHPANLRRLWVFHSWLLQHQLAGGQGLTGLLTQQQLKRGQHDVALYPNVL